MTPYTPNNSLPKKDPRPMIFLNPGEIYVTGKDYIIETVLGSCVAVAIWDQSMRFGGMNHIVLSKQRNMNEAPSSRFAEHALKRLTDRMKAHKSNPANWKAYIIGGSQQFSQATYTVGNDNFLAARKWLLENQIPIKLQEIGGSAGRMVKFEPFTGKIRIEYIQKVIGK